MKGTKILGTVLAIALMVFVIAPIASAQTYADILHDQWFKAKLSVKGYLIANDDETVLEKGSGKWNVYLYMSYGAGAYTITTCMQDELNNTQWHKIVNIIPISTDNIYGTTYPQVWDFQSNYLQFYDGESYFDIYLTFYTKITADGFTLKNANIINVACALYADLVNDEYALGSCSLSGPLIKASNVATRVPLGCQ
jgi:hypothetical protein